MDMALHSRDTVTVSAVVATRSRADCRMMEGHTSLSTAPVFLTVTFRTICVVCIFRMLPMARVVYCSATGVTDVKNMVNSHVVYSILFIIFSVQGN